MILHKGEVYMSTGQEQLQDYHAAAGGGIVPRGA